MKRIFRIWLPLLLSGIFISCIDDKYDLDNRLLMVATILKKLVQQTSRKSILMM